MKKSSKYLTRWMIKINKKELEFGIFAYHMNSLKKKFHNQSIRLSKKHKNKLSITKINQKTTKLSKINKYQSNKLISLIMPNAIIANNTPSLESDINAQFAKISIYAKNAKLSPNTPIRS